MKKSQLRNIIRESIKELMGNKVDYEYLIKIILDAQPKYNVFYNVDHNVVNIGGVGYDKGDLVTQFKQKPGSSLNIKNNFYYAQQDPDKTKEEVERLSKGRIKVDIDKGIVKYSLNDRVIKQTNNK